MYDNVGEKVKVLARIFFVLGVIAAVVGGIAMMAISSTQNEEGAGLAVGGLFTLLLGPFAAYGLSLPIYAFGELIERISDISSDVYSINNSLQTSNAKNEKKKAILTTKFEKLERLLNEQLISREEYKTAVMRLTNEKDYE